MSKYYSIFRQIWHGVHNTGGEGQKRDDIKDELILILCYMLDNSKSYQNVK